MVTLEPIESEVDEPVDLVFVPVDACPKRRRRWTGRRAATTPPEPLIDGTIDLGAIATEFLLLAIDPYPRKPGAEFEPPTAGETPRPIRSRRWPRLKKARQAAGEARLGSPVVSAADAIVAVAACATDPAVNLLEVDSCPKSPHRARRHGR